MLQQRMSGPIRSSKMSSTCGSSAISSTHGQSRCDLVFSFLTWSGARASSASSRARYSRARSGPKARTGERYPCSSNARTCASLRTFSMTLRLRLDQHRGVLRGLVAHVRGEFGAERPRLRELQPQPEHVALLVRLVAVHEARPRMQRRVVVDELDVAPLQIHVQAQIGPARLLVEEVERFLLQRSQRHATLDRARVDLVADQPAAHDAVALAEHGNRPLGYAALGQRGLAANVVEAVVE